MEQQKRPFASKLLAKPAAIARKEASTHLKETIQSVFILFFN
jgi:hypothetical protein